MSAVVLNRAGSERHRTLCSQAIEKIGLPVAGCVMRDPSLVLPERHLGLVQASEHPEIDAHIERLADAMEQAIDLDALLSLARPVEMPQGSVEAAITPPGQRIALAQDAAFTFLYPHLQRPLRMKCLMPPAMCAGCRVDIPSFTRARLRRPRISRRVCCAFRKRSQFMGNAVAIWCWVRGWKMQMA
jgi:hypothetical protein